MARRAGGRGARGGYGGSRGSRGGYGGRGFRGRTKGNLSGAFPRRTWTTTRRTKSGLRIVQHSAPMPRQGGGISATRYTPPAVEGAPADTQPPSLDNSTVEKEAPVWLGTPLTGRWAGKASGYSRRRPGKAR